MTQEAPASPATPRTHHDRAVALDGDGIRHFEDRDYQAAVACWQAAIEVAPSWAIPRHHLGCGLLRLDRHDEAEVAFRASIARDALHDASYVALFHVLEQAGRHDEANAWLARLDSLRPGHAETAFLRGSSALGRENYETARALLDRGLACPVPTTDTRMLPYGVVTEPRLVHDLAQCRYLRDLGILHDLDPVIDTYEMVLDAFPRHDDPDWTTAPTLRLEPELLSRLRPFYRRVRHLCPAPAHPGSPLQRPDWSRESRQAGDWFVVDDALQPEVLDALLRALWRSTIWHNDAQKGRNYLAAYRQNGLALPLVRQIAEALQNALPERLAGLKLLEYWAYRVACGRTAVGAHADSSAVNVNLWLTAERSRVDHSGGGLILYDQKAPIDWDYHQYNDNREAIEALLEDTGRTTVPYRQNRAVVFDSRTFHASDPAQFGDGYEDARINLTFLFGC